MDIGKLFEAENGFYVIDGIAIVSDSVDPTENAEDGTLFFKNTGEKFKRVEGEWLQYSNKQFELLHESIYDDIVPEENTLLVSSPNLIGELEINGEVIVI